MSLINDALKRAKQAQQENPPRAPGLQFRPAEPAPRHNSGPLLLMMAVVLVVSVALAGTCIWQLSQRLGPPQPTAKVATASAASQPTATAPAPAPQPAAMFAPPAPPAPAAQAAAEAKPAATTANVTPQPSVAPATNSAASPASETVQAAPATNAPVAASEPAPPKPAPPKLQGIFYRPDRPSAVVNGKMVFVGDRVGEARVVAIGQASVTLADGGQTNVLSLEQ